MALKKLAKPFRDNPLHGNTPLFAPGVSQLVVTDDYTYVKTDDGLFVKTG